ncbi:MAG: L-lactate dehydrogenase [Nitrospirota bacterium]
MTEHLVPPKIAIIGAGRVGVTFAYALMLSGLTSEIVLIDENKERVKGEVMDLDHAIPMTHPTKVWSGEYVDCKNAAIVVITAGVAQKPGETRLDLLKRNAVISKDIIPEIVQYNANAILLITTNPVDVLSYAAWKLSGFPSQRIIGSGTILDTARFRYLLGRYYGVDTRDVIAYIIGEHGDSEIPVWSRANIAGMHLPSFCTARGYIHNQQTMDDFFYQARDAAYRIIERKGATNYAIATGLVRIVEAILRDQKTVLPVSTLIDGHYDIKDVYLSLPSLIGSAGIEWVVPFELNNEEIEGLRKSAAILKNIIKNLSLV